MLKKKSDGTIPQRFHHFEEFL